MDIGGAPVLPVAGAGAPRGACSWWRGLLALIGVASTSLPALSLPAQPTPSAATNLPAPWMSFCRAMGSLEEGCEFYSSIETVESRQSDSQRVIRLYQEVTFSRSLGGGVRRTATSEAEVDRPPYLGVSPEMEITGSTAVGTPIPEIGNLYRVLRQLQHATDGRLFATGGLVVAFHGHGGMRSECQIDPDGLPVRWTSYAGGKILEEETYEWTTFSGHRVPSRIVRTFRSPVRALTTNILIRTTGILVRRVGIPER